VRHRPLLGLALLAATLPLAAQEAPYARRSGPIERERNAWVQRFECWAPVKEGARLVVRVDAGSVRVRPGTNDRLTCQATIRIYKGTESYAQSYLNSFDLRLKPAADGGAYLTGRFAKQPHAVGAEYEIQVPLRFQLDLETSGGEIEIERLEGELRAVTAGGPITAGDITGPVRAETAGGPIELGAVAQRLEARTAGGPINVREAGADAILETSGGGIRIGAVAGTLRAETAGGDIQIARAGSDVIAETAGGEIRIGQAEGSVRAETAGGNITLAGGRGQVVVGTAGGCIALDRVQGGVRAETAGGTIRVALAATRENFLASSLATASGDVEVYLPADLPVTIEAVIEEATGHKIYTEFPLTIEGETSVFREGTVRGRGSLNGGGQVLRIHTVAGDIRILRLKPGEPPGQVPQVYPKRKAKPGEDAEGSPR
jgi:DUF4097 and DUF4098 domain-containing protein YvlB